MNPDTRLETRLIHAGEPQPRFAGAVSMPVFQSSTFEYAGRDEQQLRYIRLNNTPNHDVLHAKLAAIEHAEAALVAGSGMAAISAALLSVLRAGDHLLAQKCLYGGTHALITQELPRLGIEVTPIDPDAPHTWPDALRPNTRAIYVESISNPLLEIPDLEAVVAFAREHGLVSLIDNTFATPVLYQPARHGFDLVLHSATKYLNGHSDIVAGVVAGSRARIDAVRERLNHFGGTLDPHACFLLYRGLKTLAVRVRAQCETAARLAAMLAEHSKVASVRYPGLEAHPQHQRARRLFSGFGAMVSFELSGGATSASAFLDALELPVIAPSLGGVETLISLPAQTSHADLTPRQRAELGIADGLVRVSVGLEAAEDLLADFAHALGRM